MRSIGTSGSWVPRKCEKVGQSILFWRLATTSGARDGAAKTSPETPEEKALGEKRDPRWLRSYPKGEQASACQEVDLPKKVELVFMKAVGMGHWPNVFQ